jgi:hypothetical protein
MVSAHDVGERARRIACHNTDLIGNILADLRSYGGQERRHRPPVTGMILVDRRLPAAGPHGANDD